MNEDEPAGQGKVQKLAKDHVKKLAKDHSGRVNRTSAGRIARNRARRRAGDRNGGFNGTGAGRIARDLGRMLNETHNGRLGDIEVTRYTKPVTNKKEEKYQAKNEENGAKNQSKTNLGRAENETEARYQPNPCLQYQAKNEEDESKYQAKTNRGQATSETEAKHETAHCQRYQAKNKEDEVKNQAKTNFGQAESETEGRYQTNLCLQYQAKNEEDEARHQAKTSIDQEGSETEAKYQTGLETNLGQAESETEARYQTNLRLQYQAENKEDEARHQAKTSFNQEGRETEAKYQTGLDFWYQAKNEEDGATNQAKTGIGTSQQDEARYDGKVLTKALFAMCHLRDVYDENGLPAILSPSPTIAALMQAGPSDEARHQAKTSFDQEGRETEAKYQTGLDFRYQAKNKEDGATNQAKTGIGTSQQDEARCDGKVLTKALFAMFHLGDVYDENGLPAILSPSLTNAALMQAGHSVQVMARTLSPTTELGGLQDLQRKSEGAGAPLLQAGVVSDKTGPTGPLGYKTSPRPTVLAQSPACNGSGPAAYCLSPTLQHKHDFKVRLYRIKLAGPALTQFRKTVKPINDKDQALDKLDGIKEQQDVMDVNNTKRFTFGKLPQDALALSQMFQQVGLGHIMQPLHHAARPVYLHARGLAAQAGVVEMMVPHPMQGQHQAAARTGAVHQLRLARLPRLQDPLRGDAHLEREPEAGAERPAAHRPYQRAGGTRRLHGDWR